MRLQIRYLLLHVNSVLHDLWLAFLSFDTHFKYFIDDFLKIFNHIVVLILSVLVGLVYDADEYLPIVLEGSSKSLQIVVDLFSWNKQESVN